MPANGALADLSDMISADAPYYPRALEAFQQDGKQYALPESFSTVLLFYNKDLFDQAGIDYPTADWTWDDAMTAAKAIRALGDDMWGHLLAHPVLGILQESGSERRLPLLQRRR